MIGSGVIAVKIHVMYTKSWTLILSDNLVTINFFNLAVKWLIVEIYEIDNLHDQQ